MTPYMDTIVVGGNEIAFELKQGKNAEDAIVFLHGIGTSMDIWDAQIDFFSSRYRTARFDWKGHGSSRLNAPNPNFSLEGLAKDLKHVLSELNIRKPYIVAHDGAGVIALKADIEDLVKSKGMILINAADRMDKIKPKMVSKWIENKTPSLSMKESLHLKDTFEHADESAIEGWCRSISGANLADQSPYISIPVEFIIGKGNSVIKQKAVEAAVGRIPKSRFTPMNHGDFIMLENKQGLNEEIKDFLEIFIPSL
ncbi:alpha/beta fold hydrolase [Candidatus Bathyarchaeota archaeon]|nr:alpha/beta fold hydrolase [Candidatus Bathyarchaeota archaeon]